MENIGSIGVILALIATSIAKAQSGSHSRKDFKKFLKAIKKSKQAQEAEMQLVDESNHYKFHCKSLIEGEEGEKRIIVFSKTTSDSARAAYKRKSSLRKICGIDDIDTHYFRF